MKFKKKICIIGSGHWSATTGGSEYQIKLLVEKLKENEEIEIYFITHNVARDYTPHGYHIKKLNPNKILFHYATLFGIREAYQYLKEIKPDVIYQRGSSALIFGGARFSMRYGAKLIWHVASDSNLVEKEELPKIYQLNRYADKKLFEYGIKKAHAVIAQTEYQARWTKKYNESAVVRVIRNFHPLPENQNSGKKKDQIIWVANIKQLKQPKLFIDLAKSLNEKTNVQCIMVGSPALYPPNYQQMLETEIESVNNLRYIGKQPLNIVNELIKESKLFVNTSKWEGFPNTYIQAWMRETPVVTVNCDPDDVIKNFGLGLHSENYRNLVTDTHRLLNEDELRTTMGKRAKAYALKHHSLSNIDEMIDIICG